MDAGVYVDANLGIGEQAKYLEDAGFSHLWVYESPLVFGELFMAMLEAARATSTIKIGPGVTQPLARPAFANAQGMATLAVAAPDRTFMGIGIGNSARWSLGMKPATQDVMFEHLQIVRDLLAGGTADYREGDRRQPIRFLHPDGRWINLENKVDMWVSAFGPKGQRRSGAEADGVLVRWEGEEGINQVRQNLAEGAATVGRDPAEVQIGTVFAVYPIENEKELETDEAREALGPLVISRLRYLTANHKDSSEVPEPFRPGFDAYMKYRETLDEATRHVENYEGYLVFVPEHLWEFVTPESMRTVATIASPADVTAELMKMADAGVDQVTLQMAGPPRSWCQRMGDQVLPALNQNSA
ncbi:MAG: LLM class flavin-dependent oxidoreductase [Solirubrobacterales bacterium]